MAGSPGSKYYDIFLRFRVWLETKSGEEVVSSEFFSLMNNIKEHGSIVSAADKMKISFRKAWDMVKETEIQLNVVLIKRSRGGKSGGKSELTEDGFRLIKAYEELQLEIDTAIYQITKKFFGTINK
jgi:molybdate transport system regulatory protein